MWQALQPCLKSSATITISPTPATIELSKAPTADIKDLPKEEVKEEKPKPARKVPTKIDIPGKQNESKVG